MPVYEYLCESCGKHQEAIQKFSDAPLTDCELCGAKGALKKQISRSSFALKGSGWYTTDYKRAAKPAVSESAPSAEKAAPTEVGAVKAPSGDLAAPLKSESPKSDSTKKD